jgi:hypothetical protein
VPGYDAEDKFTDSDPENNVIIFDKPEGAPMPVHETTLVPNETQDTEEDSTTVSTEHP